MHEDPGLANSGIEKGGILKAALGNPIAGPQQAAASGLGDDSGSSSGTATPKEGSEFASPGHQQGMQAILNSAAQQPYMVSRLQPSDSESERSRRRPQSAPSSSRAPFQLGGSSARYAQSDKRRSPQSQGRSPPQRGRQVVIHETSGYSDDDYEGDSDPEIPPWAIRPKNTSWF